MKMHRAVIQVAFIGCLACVHLTLEPALGQAAPKQVEGKKCCEVPVDCTNEPYSLKTDCWTSDQGPAKADLYAGLLSESTSMLYCEGGEYALCAYSGPDDVDYSIDGEYGDLPCAYYPGGSTASCTCEVFDSGAGGTPPAYYVGIFSILNLCFYHETVATCGFDGSLCKNMPNCKDDPNSEACQALEVPPICSHINAQADTQSEALPFADRKDADLISAFSFAMAASYPPGSVSCTEGIYVGCMTAECQYAAGQEGTGEIQCECPLMLGPYELGIDGALCQVQGDDWVWSSAHMVDEATECKDPTP